MKISIVRYFVAGIIGFIYGSIVSLVGTILIGGVIEALLHFVDLLWIFTASYLPLSICFSLISLLWKRDMSRIIRWGLAIIVAYIVVLYTVTYGMYYYQQSHFSVGNINDYLGFAPFAFYFLPITAPFIVISMYFNQYSVLPYWMEKFRLK